MGFRISYTFILVCIYICFETTGPVRLFFSDNLAYPPKPFEIRTGSLFYTGELAHVSSFTCTSDNASYSVVWYDSNGCEVSPGNGSGSALYWTGNSWNKTLHTSNNTGDNLLNELNDGNNFTCKINETKDFKVIGIYYVRPLPDSINGSVPYNGFRLFSNDTPPTVYEFTLQRGSFSIDRSAIIKVQSLQPSNLSFTPALINQGTTASVLDNVQFNTSSVCQIVGQYLFDSVYIGFSDQPFLLAHAGTPSYYPTFSNAYCIRNGTAFKFSIGLNSSSIRVDCPLVFNGKFINLNSLNFDTSSRSRLWIDFTETTPVTLQFDREFVCEDKYGTRASFRVEVVASDSIQVYDSDNSTHAAMNGSDYVGSSNGIPSTLYCLSGVASTGVKWYSDTQANRSVSQSIELVNSTGDGSPIAIFPRVGRRDLLLNRTIAPDREGYYSCRDDQNVSVKFGIFSLPPVAPLASILHDPSNLQVIIGEFPQVLVCESANSPHPPPISYWIGPLYAGNASLDPSTLLEANSGKYACVSSNVLSSSTINISIAVVPPSPRLIRSQVGTVFLFKPFQILCEFSTYMNVTPSFAVDWYHNGTLLNLTSTNTTIDASSHSVESILSVPSPSFAQSGYYSCVARVGSSSSSNSTLHIPIYPVYLPDAISLAASSVTYKRATLSWNATAMLSPLTEVYTLFYRRTADSRFMDISSSNTSLTLHGLVPSTEYEAYLNASNQFGTRQGPTLTFLTEPSRLFFIRNGSIVPFLSGSIFRGDNQEVRESVTEFHCVPDSPSQLVTWYLPNGAQIPSGSPPTSGLYHSRNLSTGVSTLHTMNAVTGENEGNNFTCLISNSSSQDVLGRYHFGIYNVETEHPGFSNFGIRLTDPDDLIYEFVYQNGVFDFDYSRVYSVECLEMVERNYYWLFRPPLISSTNISTLDELLLSVRFSPDSVCQVVRCTPYIQYVVFSNQPFILKTHPIVDIFSNSECVLDDAIGYTFEVGDSLDIIVTCPLVFDGRFLDISPDEFVLLNTSFDRDNPRRLWVDGSVTKATLSHDREFVCEDKYGTRASFWVEVVASDSIQVYDSDNSTHAATNGSNYVGSLNGIPSTLYCLSGVASTGVKWYSDTQANRSVSQSIELVNSTGDGSPIPISPRIGRRDLLLNRTIAPDREGYYCCRDDRNVSVKFGIFSLPPVAPVVSISRNVSTLQVVIGIFTPTITCTVANIPHPPPTTHWYGPISPDTSHLITADLLENDSGVYTCITSNVVGRSSSDISIDIVPPPPLLMDDGLITSYPLYLNDSFVLFCEFATFPNITSTITVFWYQNSSILLPNSSSTQITEYRYDNGVRSVLTVRNSIASQSGAYTCVSHVGASQTSNSPAIIVCFDPTPKPTLDYFSLQNAVPIHFRSQFSFKCQLSTIPKLLPYLTAEWYHNATRIITSEDIQIVASYQADSVLSTLTISNSNYSQSGGYSCSGVLLGTNSTSPVISVSVIPYVPIFNLSIGTIPPRGVYIGRYLSLYCDFLIQPEFASTVSIDWFHNGTLLNPCYNSATRISTSINLTGLVRGVLNISTADHCHAGVYHCLAYSKHSNSSVSDNYLVMFDTTPYHQAVHNLRGTYNSGQQAYALEWSLSNSPIADERFTLEFTILNSDVINYSQEMLGCNAACLESHTIVYPLSNVEPDSQYLVKVTVVNKYGQSSQLATFRARPPHTTTNSVVVTTESSTLPTDTSNSVVVTTESSTLPTDTSNSVVVTTKNSTLPTDTSNSVVVTTESSTLPADISNSVVVTTESSTLPADTSNSVVVTTESRTLPTDTSNSVVVTTESKTLPTDTSNSVVVTTESSTLPTDTSNSVVVTTESSTLPTDTSNSVVVTTESKTLPTDTSTGNDNLSGFSLICGYPLIAVGSLLLVSLMCNLVTCTCVVCRSRAGKQGRRTLTRSHAQLAPVEMVARDTVRRQHTGDNVFCNADDVLYTSGSLESANDLDTYTHESGFVYADSPARNYDFTITHTL